MRMLKRREIAVDKKAIIEHCQALHAAINHMDEVMKEKESQERGKKIAKIINSINFTLHSVEHFELGVPLDKLGNQLNPKLIKPRP